jgi:D-glycero-alpha-D-manno-heptose-7-phosphate kinase
MAIDKHVYISLAEKFDPGIKIKYSKIEDVELFSELRHDIVRTALETVGIRFKNFEITSVADVPAGTGLGSSSTFTTALLKALHIHNRRHIDPADLAELACRIEIDLLGAPIGKQDQYISAFGGLKEFTFHKDGTVTTRSVEVSDETFEKLETNILMFFTGVRRSAGHILEEQDTKTKAADPAMISNLDTVKDMGYRTRDAFISGKLNDWGEIMRAHWEAKKKRSSGMSSPAIDEWYDLAMKNGAIGGKLVGAGGGGFLLFYTEDPNRVRAQMKRAGLKEMSIHMDFEGARAFSR